MRFIKPHRLYPDVMSQHKVLFRLKKFQFTVQEFYDPHWLEFMYWRKEEEGFYVLKKWKKLPLNRYTRKLMKLGKLEGETIKLKAQLEYMSKKGR